MRRRRGLGGSFGTAMLADPSYCPRPSAHRFFARSTLGEPQAAAFGPVRSTCSAGRNVAGPTRRCESASRREAGRRVGRVVASRELTVDPAMAERFGQRLVVGQSRRLGGGPFLSRRRTSRAPGRSGVVGREPFTPLGDTSATSSSGGLRHLGDTRIRTGRVRPDHPLRSGPTRTCRGTATSHAPRPRPMAVRKCWLKRRLFLPRSMSVSDGVAEPGEDEPAARGFIQTA